MMIFSLRSFGKGILKNLLMISSILGLFLAVSPRVFAQYNGSGNTPVSTGSNTGVGGTRSGSCESTNGDPLMILAPFSHIAKTASNRPDFAWFVPTMSQSYPIEFRLYEYDENKQLKDFGEPILMSSLSGIMTFSFPEDFPQLTTGKTYLWQVNLTCNENDPSKDILVSTELEVVKIPSNLTTTNDNLETIENYLKVGLWYDALGLALSQENYQLNTLGTIILGELLTYEEDTLLREISQLNVNFNNIESSKIKEIEERLQQIISLRRIITNSQLK
jgi:sulfur transfer complex TusBCD TusB component (DsrH family)